MKTLIKNLFWIFFTQLISANILIAQNTHFLYEEAIASQTDN